MKMNCSRYDCSLIIPTRNRREVLADTLERISALQDERFDVMVVDNGSTEDTSALRSRFESVRWITLNDNRGAAARNVGAQAAQGRVLFMLDDDSWPEPGVITRAVQRLDSRPELGAIACRVLLADSGGRHDAGGVPGVFFNCGAAMRRSAFLATGGFPESFEYYAEEYVVACRMLQLGFRIEPQGDLVVWHRRTVKNRDNNRMLRLLVRNNVALWRAFAPPGLRDDLIASTIERYRRVAERESAQEGFAAGVLESERVLCGSENGPPLTVEQFEALYGLNHARRILRKWADKHGKRRVAVWMRGKGCEQIVDLLISLGLHIAAVYDSPESVGDDESWRGQALKKWTQFVANDVDMVIVGSLSPGVAEDVRCDLERSIPDVPTISLAPWMCHDVEAQAV